MGSARRQLGYTEANWCLALEGGTGVTVAAFLFGAALSKDSVQAAVTKLLAAKPFLATQIVSGNNKQLFFELGHETVHVEKLPNPPAKDDDADQSKAWLQIVDAEMNMLFPSKKPVPIFQVHLYTDLPDSAALVVLRIHSGAGDMASVSPIGSTFLNCLKEVVQKEKAGESIEELLQKATMLDEVDNFVYNKAIENSIPKGGAKKPFWAHGTDVIGYGLVSRRHAYLPFHNTKEKRESRLLRSSLSKAATEKLLEVCKENGADLYGALHGAGLKAVASFKRVGTRGEHYGVAVLFNCRPLLDPKLSEDVTGFYHSALLKTTQAAESSEFWKLASQLSKDFQDAIKNRKHFTDMGDLNMLMVQAIHHPNLTPSSTLRTALLSITYDPVIETTPVEAAEVLELKDYVASSSTHGVGPCLAIFHSIRDGELHISFVYNYPLFSEADMQTIVDSINGYIKV